MRGVCQAVGGPFAGYDVVFLARRNVTEASFEAAAREAGLGVRMAMPRYHRMVEAFFPALRTASEALQAKGFPEAAEIAEQILQTGGIALTK